MLCFVGGTQSKLLVLIEEEDANEDAIYGDDRKGIEQKKIINGFCNEWFMSEDVRYKWSWNDVNKRLIMVVKMKVSIVLIMIGALIEIWVIIVVMIKLIIRIRIIRIIIIIIMIKIKIIK